MDIAGYLEEIRKVHATGVASEHSYRPALRDLFTSIDPDNLDVINEPRRVEVGAPDFIFQRDGVARGWCEHKDIDKDIVKPKGYSKEQKDRYKQGLPNLIYTNGLEFEFLRDGQPVAHIIIADYAPGLPANPDQFDALETHLREFAAARPISIRSAKRLAELMAGKAKLIKEALDKVLKADADLQSELAQQYKGFKQNLLPNLTPGEFADIYAETVTYGMFAARFHDTTPDDFSRQEALDLLPKSNPFLRSLFQFVAGYDLDDRIAWIVDDLAQVLQAADVHALFAEYGNFTARNDPFIHFYEDFLAIYNPKKRRERGVWYTPEPVVDFIVRAVDDVLKSEFGLVDGLADTSKVTVDWDTGETDAKGNARTIKKDVHRVQILDPATGTGTFLAKAVQLIADRVKGRAPGMWQGYVENDLLPRLHGFELLMASYAMCHMKLDMQLAESGYTRSANPPAGAERLSVWLTNALEPAERERADLFWQPLAKEASGAAKVKRQTPIMCVIGNPPYSGHSSNFGDWIERLMADYKVSPALKRPAQAKWLSDDYVKFIRMAEHLVTQNGEGVVGVITNHSFLDNPTFLDMRSHLRSTFDRIFVLDLHGSTKRKDISPDGSPDVNVFDIQQGVAIMIAVKGGLTAGAEDGLATVQRFDLWGSRKYKYRMLNEMKLNSIETVDVTPQSAPWQFKYVDREIQKIYSSGFSISDLFSANGNPAPGIITTQDQFAISWSPAESRRKVQILLNTSSEDQARKHFRLCSQSQWDYQEAKESLAKGEWLDQIVPIQYRPFDIRSTVYDPHIAVHRRERLSRHLKSKLNVALMTCRQSAVPSWEHVFIAADLVDDSYISNRTKERGYGLPLYLFPDEDAEQADAYAPTERTLNFDPKLYAEICAAAGIDPADTDMARQSPFPERGGGASEAGDGGGSLPAQHDAESPLHRTASGPPPRVGEDFRTATGDARPSEVKVFDYIYGVLHSPDYRETFAEFLKIDFPRIPYPSSPAVFRHVSEKGEALRRLHLMEAGAIGDTPYPFLGEHEEEDQANVVASGYPKHEGGHVWINKHQYFENVPATAWNFYIGGYQPAQKWLKDRKGRALSYEGAGHYQKIVKILLETDRIMQQIELPLDTGDGEEG